MKDTDRMSQCRTQFLYVCAQFALRVHSRLLDLERNWIIVFRAMYAFVRWFVNKLSSFWSFTSKAATDASHSLRILNLSLDSFDVALSTVTRILALVEHNPTTK